MATLYDNLQGGATTDNPLSSGATTINSAAFQYLPTVTGPDIMYITLDPEGANGAPEIVKVTAHTAAATSVTVVRAQQATVARAHPLSSVWVHALTDVDIGEFLKTVVTANITDLNVTTAKIADLAVTTGKIAADAVTTSKILDANVTTAKITDLNVTAGKLASDAVTTAKILDANVTTAKLAATAQPAMTAWGKIAYAQITASLSAVTMVTLAAGLSVTWTAVAGRRYSFRLQCQVAQSVSGDEYVLGLEESGTELTRYVGCNSTTTAMSTSVEYISNASISGSRTWRVNYQRIAGTGNITIVAAATYPAYIIVEDIGPL